MKQVVNYIIDTCQIDIDFLVPFQGEAKSLSQKNRYKLRKEILETGFSFAFHVWKLDKQYFIIDGHQRLSVLKNLRKEGYDVPPMTCNLIKAENIKEAKQRVLQAISQYGKVSKQGLAEFVGDDFDDLMMDMRFDFPDFEFEFEDKEKKAKEEEDDIPEIENNSYGVNRGNIYLLGNHRIMCGDSTDKADVDKLMDGKKADMVFTDPPYNMASDSKNFAGDKKGGWFGDSMSDLKDADWDKNFKIEPALDRLVDSVSENSTMYIWTSHFLINDIWKHLKDFGYTSYLVWSKPNPMPSLSKRHPAWNTELCVYASRGGKRVVNYPKEGNFLSCREVVKKSDGTHPTQKPLELIIPLVEFSSDKNQLVLDLFLGSGSTLIACEKTKRICYGMEIDPHYCSVIIKRYEDHTGQTAIKYISNG